MLLAGPPPDSLRVYPVSVGAGGGGGPSVEVPISCCSLVRLLIH